MLGNAQILPHSGLDYLVGVPSVHFHQTYELNDCESHILGSFHPPDFFVFFLIKHYNPFPPKVVLQFEARLTKHFSSH